MPHNLTFVSINQTGKHQKKKFHKSQLTDNERLAMKIRSVTLAPLSQNIYLKQTSY